MANLTQQVRKSHAIQFAKDIAQSKDDRAPELEAGVMRNPQERSACGCEQGLFRPSPPAPLPRVLGRGERGMLLRELIQFACYKLLR